MQAQQVHKNNYAYHEKSTIGPKSRIENRAPNSSKKTYPLIKSTSCLSSKSDKLIWVSQLANPLEFSKLAWTGHVNSKRYYHILRMPSMPVHLQGNKPPH